MSVPAATPAGLPVVNQALEPASVRHGTPATQKAYQSALAFEQVLVEQLSKSLTATIGGGESSGEGGGSEEGGESSASGELSSTLPQALSDGIMSAGGLGLAAQMTQDLETVGGGAQTRAGTSVSATPPAAYSSGGGTPAPSPLSETGGTAS